MKTERYWLITIGPVGDASQLRTKLIAQTPMAYLADLIEETHKEYLLLPICEGTAKDAKRLLKVITSASQL